MKRIALLLAALSVAALLCAALSLSAGAIGAVDLSHVRQNESGAGYVWDNINDVLTLRDANIVTGEDFGIKLPAGATVLVEGKCRVSAARYGISCAGAVTFKGTGELTVGGEYGMYFYGSAEEDKILFLSGDYTVEGTEFGICSEKAEIAVCGGKTAFRGKIGVSGVTVTFSSCTSECGPIRAKRLVTVSGANLTATSGDGPAIVSDGKIDVRDERIEAGEKGALSAVGEYTDQPSVSFVSTYKRVRASALFGGSVPGYVDVLIFVGAGVCAAAAIAVPLIRKAVKRKKLYEKLGRKEK